MSALLTHPSLSSSFASLRRAPSVLGYKSLPVMAALKRWWNAKMKWQSSSTMMTMKTAGGPSLARRSPACPLALPGAREIVCPEMNQTASKCAKGADFEVSLLLLLLLCHVVDDALDG